LTTAWPGNKLLTTIPVVYQMMKAIVIGLTGSIGSGKSTVSNFLAALGAAIINADELGHEALKPNTETWQEIVRHFGKGILKNDDEIDRQKLGEIVFNDAQALAQLNQIMHPRMYRIVEERIEELKRHHQNRADEVLLILRKGPQHAFHVASEMTWDIEYDSWGQFPVAQKWFATGEAIAHLRYLEEMEMVFRVAEEKTITYSVKQD